MIRLKLRFLFCRIFFFSGLLDDKLKIFNNNTETYIVYFCNNNYNINIYSRYVLFCQNISQIFTRLQLSENFDNY